MADQNATPADDGVSAAPPVAEPKQKRRDRMLGTAGQVVGVIGIVVSVLLAVGVVAGRNWAVDTVDDVTAAIDVQIAKADPLLMQASQRVGEISGRVATVAGLAAGIAADPSPGGTVADTLRSGLATVSERYQVLRSNYADLRETVVSMFDRLQTLDRVLPGFAIPQGPVDALKALNARLQEFDGKVTDLITVDPGQGPVNQAAATVAQTATDIQSRIDGIQTSINDVQQRVVALRARLASTADTLKLGITLGAVGTILLLLYVAFLHWVLFRHSGERRKRGSAN